MRFAVQRHLTFIPDCQGRPLQLIASTRLSGTCRYVKSRSDSQLRGTGDDLSSTSDCDPEQVLQSDTSKIIMPCGLIAWSYFNDTYTVLHAGKHLCLVCLSI